METIKITCAVKDVLDYRKIVDFQGDVKSHDERNIEHIITSINQHGFSFPIFIWKHKGENNCLDGHGRLQALQLMERRGYTIPKIPVVYIDAETEQDARRKLIEVNNLNGDFVEEIFSQFVVDLDLNLLDFNIPGLDLEKIDAKLRGQIGLEEPEKNEEQSDNKVTVVCPECQYSFEVEV
ncbi:MAG: ParB N-terminal domain-containing protein [Planctomycetaceae bacterium]|jgi:DNA-dependent RNA polymerase auxiliary subunit epsilon|nr:ParB N-terminal domain-containing protein [Planctomycetaceae bacterium]